MVRFVEPARVSDPALILSAERAELTVTPASRAEFCAPIVKVVFTVVAPPLMLRVASVLLPLAKAAATVFTPIVRALMLTVPPLMFRVEIASPVELLAVRATLFVLIVTVPMVLVPPPRLTVPVTLPEVAVVPVRAAIFTVVASSVPESKEKMPVPAAEVAALRPPTAKVLSNRLAE